LVSDELLVALNHAFITAGVNVGLPDFKIIVFKLGHLSATFTACSRLSLSAVDGYQNPRKYGESLR
jgi:hypothetical protein